MKARILFVEDDESIGFIVKESLEMEQYSVKLCHDGDLGFEAFQSEKFDICLLDVMLPKCDGFTLGKKFRVRDSRIPIIYLTAKSMKEDKLEGFGTGGDDYITKPFSLEELICRIEVFLKRTKDNYQRQTSFSIGHYSFDPRQLTLSIAGEVKQLTRKEADILELFCTSPDTLIKRETILLKVWGEDDYFMGRSLDVFIVKIRKLLAKDHRLVIQNVHGIGFKLVVESNT